ncbi:unnamed protein product [Parnassius apollo]|uniref:(apollo) hypothetical protein n=1 Tax=Parnassius apollo TaxID=110799 RepID=A0A8S3WYE6_PARAO|nr:unnamed protein product [Parnassius apollo]
MRQYLLQLEDAHGLLGDAYEHVADDLALFLGHGGVAQQRLLGEQNACASTHCSSRTRTACSAMRMNTSPMILRFSSGTVMWHSSVY